MDDANPYHSPSSPVEPPRRRSRWRIAPATLCLVFGIVGVIATPIPLLVAHSRPVELGGGITWLRVAGVSLNGVGSILWIVSAIFCWRGRWGFTVAGVVLGFLALFGGNRLLADLNL